MKPVMRVIAVGGLKEGCLLRAAGCYINRIKSFYNIAVIELPDEPAPDNLSAAGRQAVLDCEGRRITGRFEPSNIKASLAVEGRLGDLPFFCNLIQKAAAENRCIDFIIGGSLGLSDSVLKQSDYLVSLSGLTFPHRLTRLLLLEILCLSSANCFEDEKKH